MSSSASSSKGRRKLNEVKKLSVLVVANDEIFQNEFILRLQKYGVETLGVRNKSVAFNIHDKIQMRFDLILMSSIVPMMDGLQATKNFDQWGLLR
ncbi:hypothetical protein H5410_061836 [Solanum commersonii]|uniref:Response regulatory domain-containing protein n=1 Tax=Solanum commersonii TaxID=4109 RepID=A0A9J5WAU1_SOLCO|nr:hypothetical protein H5410_061836 [Solanum commersonii]